jgi:hypothetical protein
VSGSVLYHLVRTRDCITRERLFHYHIDGCFGDKQTEEAYSGADYPVADADYANIKMSKSWCGYKFTRSWGPRSQIVWKEPTQTVKQDVCIKKRCPRRLNGDSMAWLVTGQTRPPPPPFVRKHNQMKAFVGLHFSIYFY